MSDNGKKRTNSFRKLLPLFFSHKSKDKNSSKNTRASLKSPYESSTKNNQYQIPRSLPATGQTEVEDNERIYENLTLPRPTPNTIEHVLPKNEALDNHSSSSTLVSESIRDNHKKIGQYQDNFVTPRENVAARPQVPPKPNNEVIYSLPNKNNNSHPNSYPYPDTYYHSIEKLADQMSVLDEIEIYRASQSQANPASVGAEIKKVSTKFLISPKKEAEVRTIQPIRARSLSFDNKEQTQKLTPERSSLRNNNLKKPYNYSAPTSPLPINHRNPNIPKAISPYEQVRKTMIETEEKRNSLSRNTLHNKTPSPRPQNTIDRSGTPKLETSKVKPEEDKEKTRQKVEAFYWQKLRELKLKEDDYYIRQSIGSTPPTSPVRRNTSQSTCSTPVSFVVEPRSYSLPRGRDLSNQPIYSPFIRGVSVTHTDTSIRNRSSFSGAPSFKNEGNIVYRHPDKLIRNASPIIVDKQQTAIFQRGSLTDDLKNSNQQQKRVSFDEQTSKPLSACGGSALKWTNNVNGSLKSRNDGSSSGTKLCDGPRDTRGPPLPPVRTTSVGRNYKVPNNKIIQLLSGQSIYSESESGSEAGEIQRIMQTSARIEEDWHGDVSRRDGSNHDLEGLRSMRGRQSRRDDPRRHTLTENHNLYIGAGHHGSATDMVQSQHHRGHPNALLFDDDPGIMSEVETASTGFRRGGKQRSSLPVVRTPSKTLERPLGLVFLQYRSETKRALLPNEITSIDTVKALFVRSFPKQLSMQYMDSPKVKIYIHEPSKNMFYELEDIRAHLRDIRDRSVLRLFESNDVGGGEFPGALGVGNLVMPSGLSTCSGPTSFEADTNYFSEPEIDSDYHSQHVHKSKVKAPAYYMGTGPGLPSTLPRGGTIVRAFSPGAPPVPPDRVKSMPNSGMPGPCKPMRYVAGSGSERCYPYAPGSDQLYNNPGHGNDGYMSSPERNGSRVTYEDPYYTQFIGPAAGRVAVSQIIDEETADGAPCDEYQMYGVNHRVAPAPRMIPRGPGFEPRMGTQVEDMQRLRVEKMERQLANLTGLVQKALQVPGVTAPAAAPRTEYPTYTRTMSQDAARFGSNERPPKLGRDKFQKSVSFEKSVSFCDDPPDMNSPKQHSPQHSADTKPTKPAIKSSTLPRTSSQERDRLKPAPPPKPAGLASTPVPVPSRTYILSVNSEYFSQLRVLQKQSRDLRHEVRNLRRSTTTQSGQLRQLMAEAIIKIGALSEGFNEGYPELQVTREEEIYRQDMLLLENDLYELEATVERLRGQAANRETRVNMADIERIAMILSKSSKTVADYKTKFPQLQETVKKRLTAEMEKVVRKEKILEEEPERLELALRRCKKLTGTLVTLKRLACIQEQRLPPADGRVSPSGSSSSTAPVTEEINDIPCNSHNKGLQFGRTGDVGRGASELRHENALDALLDELQTFSQPIERGRGDGPLRRLASYPSGSDTDASPPVRARGQHPPKPPVPERHPELLNMAARRAPPPPPPRTTSRSPLASPTSPTSPPRTDSDHPDFDKSASRQAQLELRHQELLKKQKALQEQYQRLQMVQRSGSVLPPNAQPDLKKTGSESNLLAKMNLNLAAASISGSMTHLAGDCKFSDKPATKDVDKLVKNPESAATTNKVYETDIL